MKDGMPDLDWSAQSPHIRSLFRPWSPGDGYDDEVLLAAEAQLLTGGAHLPKTLRSFYRAWGRRRDLTQMNEQLLAPKEWVIHAGALIFCVENQACAYWGIPLESLPTADPPVVVADAGPEDSLMEVSVELDWNVNYPRVSTFLDGLTYLHAFSRGALHGGWSKRVRLLPEHVAWLEQAWGKVTWISPQIRGYDLATGGSTMYVRDGQAVDVWSDSVAAVVTSAEALDQIAHRFSLAWEERW